MKKLIISLSILSLPLFVGCATISDSDDIQRRQQEQLLKEGTAQTGMPAVKNFRERKLVKMLIELRDQENLNTYTYTFAEASGQRTFLCNSVGYGIPFATQYTNPEKYEYNSTTIPQADPSGLFPPTSADSTWVMCKSPDGKVTPLYVEPKIIVSPYKL